MTTNFMSGTPPYGHPRNATICDNADTLLSLEYHLHRLTIRTPKIQPPRYSVKRTLGLAPTISPHVQTRPYNGHFDKKFLDSLVKQAAKRAKA